jgi:hypothetical protein
MITPEQQTALDVARGLVRAGVPVFLARPDDTEPTGYKLPRNWHLFTASPQAVDDWAPGLALVAVTGCGLDLVDIDPRSGGTLASIRDSGVSMPEVYLMAETPSGGTHCFVKSIGVPSLDGVFPGVDLKSGAPDGSGRGLAFLAPTVRRSKVDGVPREYRWVGEFSSFGQQSSLFQADNSGVELAQHVYSKRAYQASTEQPRRVARSAAAREFDSAWNKLVTNLRHWSSTGWGGGAHAGLLAATTFLARIAPDHAEHAFREAFRAADLEPDAADLAKLESALQRVVPDVVVPDDQMSPTERFLSGGDSPLGGTAPSSVPGAIGAASVAFEFLDEFEAESIPIPDPLIEGLLFQNTKARLFGPSTVGKTWVTLDLCAHVQNGMDWQGLRVTQRDVLYVAGEGAASFAPRMRTWREYHGKKTGVRLWPEPVQIGGAQWPAFIEAVTRCRFGLIVLDTQASMTVGRKEDSNDDAGHVQAALDQLRGAVSACVLGVHHTGWEEQERARGASAMFGAQDTELQLAEAQGGVKLVQKKQRYAEKGAPVALRFEKAHGGLVVLPKSTTAGFFAGDPTDVRAQALYARLTAYEASGGAIPPRLSVRSLVKVLREECNEQGENAAMEQAARLFKASKGQSVIVEQAS